MDIPRRDNRVFSAHLIYRGPNHQGGNLIALYRNVLRILCVPLVLYLQPSYEQNIVIRAVTVPLPISGIVQYMADSVHESPTFTICLAPNTLLASQVQRRYPWCRTPRMRSTRNENNAVVPIRRTQSRGKRSATIRANAVSCAIYQATLSSPNDHARWCASILLYSVPSTMSTTEGQGEEQLSRGAWAGRVLGVALTGAATMSQVKLSMTPPKRALVRSR